jgi:hypothetical protein
VCCIDVNSNDGDGAGRTQDSAANGAGLGSDQRIEKPMTSALLPRRTDQSLAKTPVKVGKSQLFRLVLPFVAVILFQAALAGVSLEILSSVRAYVGDESIWSKGQKDAIHFLTLYAHTGEEQYFRKFKSAIAVPLADRAARYALEQSPPDLDGAYRNFVSAGNHAEDGSHSSASVLSRNAAHGAGASPLARDRSLSG